MMELTLSPLAPKGLAKKSAQWLGASNIFRKICKSTSEWRGFESREFYHSGFEFAKTPLLILNH